MRVVLSFDAEVWCDGWQDLDRKFPACFEYYLHGYRGQPRHYGLAGMLETLQRHRLHGVFFVEPLFAVRFDLQYLRQLVSLIQDAGQEVQLHLHPEWVDEVRPDFIANATSKRALLSSYSLEEQSALIAWAAQLLQQAGAPAPTAFRAGNFGANRDTLRALARNAIHLDSSFNVSVNPQALQALEPSADGGQSVPDPRFPFTAEGVCSVPVSLFRDFTGKMRHAQLCACSFEELAAAMTRAAALGQQSFVVLAHNFELLDRARNRSNPVVAQRFEQLCRFLAEHRSTLPTGSLAAVHAVDAPAPPRAPLVLPRRAPQVPRVPLRATVIRLWEQALQTL